MLENFLEPEVLSSIIGTIGLIIGAVFGSKWSRYGNAFLTLVDMVRDGKVTPKEARQGKQIIIDLVKQEEKKKKG
jgi:hypothetical protein